MIDNNEVLRMLNEGKKQKDIAKHFGVSRVAIHKRVKKIRAQAESKDKEEINQGDVTHTHAQECSTTSEPNSANTNTQTAGICSIQRRALYGAGLRCWQRTNPIFSF